MSDEATVDDRTLPALPDGWKVAGLGQADKNWERWETILVKGDASFLGGSDVAVNGIGASPRTAILAAMEKIK